jgi:hypothetical protein
MRQAERVMLDSVRGYDEVLITGGEPMLDPDRTAGIIHTLRENNPDAKIYLYTALYRPQIWTLFHMVDGIQFSLHAEANCQDICDFIEFQTELRLRSLEGKSLRLYIDNRIKFGVKIYPLLWQRAEVKPWLTEAQLIALQPGGLPPGERLFILQD